MPEPVTVGVTGKQIGELAGILITIIAFVWGFAYRIGRPFVDQSRYESWIRRSTDYERHMRTTMFAGDFSERKAIKRLAVRALRVANKNGDAIAAMIEQQRAQTVLLGSIPHLAASMENMSTNMEAMSRQIAEANKISVQHGEILAAHGALLGAKERRHDTRRAEDVLAAPRMLLEDPNA